MVWWLLGRKSNKGAPSTRSRKDAAYRATRRLIALLNKLGRRGSKAHASAAGGSPFLHGGPLELAVEGRVVADVGWAEGARRADGRGAVNERAVVEATVYIFRDCWNDGRYWGGGGGCLTVAALVVLMLLAWLGWQRGGLALMQLGMSIC